jgi:dimethylglycine dehydrogenase
MHDREWLERHLAPGLRLSDETPDWSCQILTGPAARAILSEVAEADLTRPWLTHQQARIAGRPVWLVRVSFAGELGWELHTRTQDTAAVYDAVLDAGERHGLRPFGMMALDSLRIEKGYRAWKGDLSTDYTLSEAALDRFIDWAKPDFRGKAALAAERQRGIAKRFVGLTVQGNPQDAPYMASLRRDGQVVGEVTSGGWGHRVGASIALGTVRADLAAPGTALEIGIFGGWYPAVVHDGPHYDPGNHRLKA